MPKWVRIGAKKPSLPAGAGGLRAPYRAVKIGCLRVPSRAHRRCGRLFSVLEATVAATFPAAGFRGSLNTLTGVVGVPAVWRDAAVLRPAEGEQCG